MAISKVDLEGVVILLCGNFKSGLGKSSITCGNFTIRLGRSGSNLVWQFQGWGLGKCSSTCGNFTSGLVRSGNTSM